MTLEKPAAIAANAFKSQKWDEITDGREFSKSDIPTLCLLCHWHLVADQCIEDTTDENGRVIVAYSNKIDDIKAMPHLDALNKASKEIRALNKQLGINDTAEPEKKRTSKANVLELVTNGKREVARRAR